MLSPALLATTKAVFSLGLFAVLIVGGLHTADEESQCSFTGLGGRAVAQILLGTTFDVR